MKERPIIMGAESVLAILEGRKTQTRRVINPRKYNIAGWDMPRTKEDMKAGYPFAENADGDFFSVVEWCPYGNIGDRLWVREKYGFIGKSFDEPSSRIAYSTAVAPNGEMKNIIYYTDCPDMAWCDGDGYTILRKNGQEVSFWKSPLFMPRWASRITLEITDIRVERVQDISVQDAKDEGIRVHANGCKDGLAYGCYNGDECVKNVCRQPIEYYKQLWDELNAKRGYPWESNPWVWVIEFKVVENGK